MGVGVLEIGGLMGRDGLKGDSIGCKVVLGDWKAGFKSRIGWSCMEQTIVCAFVCVSWGEGGRGCQILIPI